MSIYSQMDRQGTAAMLALGLPFFAASLLTGASLQDEFAGSWLIALVAAPLIWSFIYSKTLGWFRSLNPARPLWWFPAGALLAQAGLVAAAYAAA